MTISEPATNQHQATARPAKMRWTNAEIGAHLLASVVEALKSARGEKSVYDASGPNAETDEQMVARVTERDPAALADEIVRSTSEFPATVRALAVNRLFPPIPHGGVAK